jgi:hypothetical protein
VFGRRKCGAPAINGETLVLAEGGYRMALDRWSGDVGWCSCRRVTHETGGGLVIMCYIVTHAARSGSDESRLSVETHITQEIITVVDQDVSCLKSVELSVAYHVQLSSLRSRFGLVGYRKIKSRRMRWAGHVARMGEGRNVYRVLVGKSEKTT